MNEPNKKEPKKVIIPILILSILGSISVSILILLKSCEQKSNSCKTIKIEIDYKIPQEFKKLMQKLFNLGN